MVVAPKVANPDEKFLEWRFRVDRRKMLADNPFLRIAKSVVKASDFGKEDYERLRDNGSEDALTILGDMIKPAKDEAALNGFADAWLSQSMMGLLRGVVRQAGRAPGERMAHDVNEVRRAVGDGWEAVYEKFADKIPVTKDMFVGIAEELKGKYFYVSRAEEIWMVEEIKSFIVGQIELGTPYAPVSKEMQLGFGQVLGITGADPWYLNMVLQTNVQSAHYAGWYLDMMEMADLFPKWLYTGPGLPTSRPWHVALYGSVFMLGDPVGDSLIPPNDYNCYCGAVSLDKYVADEYDLYDPSKDIQFEFGKKSFDGTLGDLMGDFFQWSSPNFMGNPLNYFTGITDHTMDLYSMWEAS